MAAQRNLNSGKKVVADGRYSSVVSEDLGWLWKDFQSSLPEFEKVESDGVGGVCTNLRRFVRLRQKLGCCNRFWTCPAPFSVRTSRQESGPRSRNSNPFRSSISTVSWHSSRHPPRTAGRSRRRPSDAGPQPSRWSSRRCGAYARTARTSWFLCRTRDNSWSLQGSSGCCCPRWMVYTERYANWLLNGKLNFLAKLPCLVSWWSQQLLSLALYLLSTYLVGNHWYWSSLTYLAKLITFGLHSAWCR